MNNKLHIQEIELFIFVMCNLKKKEYDSTRIYK